MIHVCSLAALPEIVRITGASHVLTVMRNVEQVQRPASVLAANHLRVPMDDITEPMEGYTPPASAFAAACMLNPHRDEMEIARKLRAASPIASPNRLIVSHADKALGRNGRMIRALEAISPATMMVEGKPFLVELE
jgi:predicted protein tyrosine phosphatase